MLFDAVISGDYDMNSCTNVEIRSGNDKSSCLSLFITVFKTSIPEYFFTHPDGDDQVLLFYTIINGVYAMIPCALFLKS